jgi:hypothetical protein
MSGPLKCNCPLAKQLPSGVLAPNSGNLSKRLAQAQLARNGKGTLIVPNALIGSLLQSGRFISPTNAIFQAPTLICTIIFPIPFPTPPTISVTLDDLGSNKSWMIHVRNVTTTSMDLILKNADKAFGETFVVYWTAFGF